MNINIQEIINLKIKEMDENKIVEKTIGDTIEKVVIKAVTDSIDGYSIKRLIEEKVTKEVSEVVADIGFTAYNSFIAEKVKAITEGVCNKDISDKIQKIFDEILVIKRDSIKISEICKQYKEWICEEIDDSEKYDLEKFFVSVKESDSYGWLDFEFAKDKPERYHSSDNSIKFTVHRNSKDKKTGWISSVYIDGYGIDKTMKFGHMSEIETLLVNLNYNKTPIEIDVEDEDDIDNYFDIDN